MWVIHVVSSERKRLPLIPRLWTYRCGALSDAKGQEETHALQQSRASFEIAGQAFS
jgi:hypothetical protein